MQVIADLHIHSKYSRATSPQMNVVALDFWARKKGINLMATGDFTHPAYVKELKENLAEDGSGFLSLKKDSSGTSFILSAEIACIYKDKGKCRRLHVCLLAPDLETIEKINKELEKRKFNIRSDGRPIIGLSAKDLATLCWDINEKVLVIPAHIWTPWFGLLGSKSGYDALEDCFEDLSDRIYAVETGLSSDPEMNWRLSALDRFCLISNSDAHSPANIGREANVFEFKENAYDELVNVFKTKDKDKFLYTVEFFPQEGRYHFDGHSKCKFSCAPEESIKKHKNICPVCKRSLVLGVEHRVEELADRELGFVPDNSIPYKSLVPLQEIIAECMQRGKNTKGVQSLYEEMIAKENEFNILINLEKDKLESISNELITEAIIRVRNKKVYTIPGYDGEYGIVKVFSPEEIKDLVPKQKSLI